MKSIIQNCASEHTCVSGDDLMIAVARVIVVTTHFLNYLLGLLVWCPQRKDLVDRTNGLAHCQKNGMVSLSMCAITRRENCVAFSLLTALG